MPTPAEEREVRAARRAAAREDGPTSPLRQPIFSPVGSVQSDASHEDGEQSEHSAPLTEDNLSAHNHNADSEVEGDDATVALGESTRDDVSLTSTEILSTDSGEEEEDFDDEVNPALVAIAQAYRTIDRARAGHTVVIHSAEHAHAIVAQGGLADVANHAQHADTFTALAAVSPEARSVINKVIFNG